jgi:hypothetical protein
VSPASATFGLWTRRAVHRATSPMPLSAPVNSATIEPATLSVAAPRSPANRYGIDVGSRSRRKTAALDAERICISSIRTCRHSGDVPLARQVAKREVRALRAKSHPTLAYPTSSSAPRPPIQRIRINRYAHESERLVLTRTPRGGPGAEADATSPEREEVHHA